MILSGCDSCCIRTIRSRALHILSSVAQRLGSARAPQIFIDRSIRRLDRSCPQHWPCQDQRLVTSTSIVANRKNRSSTINAKAPTEENVGLVGTVRIMSPATRSSSPSKMARPIPWRTVR